MADQLQSNEDNQNANTGPPPYESEDDNNARINDPSPTGQFGPYQLGPPLSHTGIPQTLPSIPIGTSVVAPGPWAAYVRSMPWTKAVRSTRPKSELLRHLLSKSVLREPVLRFRLSSAWTPAVFSERIGRKLANIEAIMIYIVGHVPTDPCLRCQMGYGPFATCVQASGTFGCDNCHWEGNGSRCSFHPNPAAPRITNPRRKSLTAAEKERSDQLLQVIREEQARLQELRRLHNRRLRNHRQRLSNLVNLLTFSRYAIESVQGIAAELRDAVRDVQVVEAELDDMETRILANDRRVIELSRLLS